MQVLGRWPPQEASVLRAGYPRGVAYIVVSRRQGVGEEATWARCRRLPSIAS